MPVAISREGFGSAWLTEATVSDIDYFRYSFLEGLVQVLLENLHLVTIHAACVVEGRTWRTADGGFWNG